MGLILWVKGYSKAGGVHFDGSECTLNATCQLHNALLASLHHTTLLGLHGSHWNA
jgi:hypothetical protein